MTNHPTGKDYRTRREYRHAKPQARRRAPGYEPEPTNPGAAVQRGAA